MNWYNGQALINWNLGYHVIDIDNARIYERHVQMEIKFGWYAMVKSNKSMLVY